MNSSAWISAIFDIFLQLYKYLKARSHEGIYEMLEYEAVLELLGPKGESGILKKRQRVKFLQDNVIAFQDHAWGDGKVLQNYQCSPGAVVDHYKDADRWNVLISLRETKSSGDVEEFYIQRKLLNSFGKKEEWWQLMMYHETRQLKFSIIFPPKRHCRRAVLVEKNKNRTQLLGSEHFAQLPDRRQILTWEIDKPRRFETYTVRWNW